MFFGTTLMKKIEKRSLKINVMLKAKHTTFERLGRYWCGK